MDRVLHHSVRIDCNSDRAFEMFTDNELLASWFPVEADVDPVLGGKYELFWDPDDKENNSTKGCKVTAVEPGKMLAFEWKGPLQFKEFMVEFMETNIPVSIAFLMPWTAFLKCPFL